MTHHHKKVKHDHIGMLSSYSLSYIFFLLRAQKSTKTMFTCSLIAFHLSTPPWHLSVTVESGEGIVSYCTHSNRWWPAQ